MRPTRTNIAAVSVAIIAILLTIVGIVAPPVSAGAPSAAPKVFTCPTDDPYEPNDEEMSPTLYPRIGVGTLISAISCGSDEDWFQFTTIGAVELTIDLTPATTGGDIDLQLYGTSGLLATSSLSFQDERIVHTVAGAGTYYVKVNPSGGNVPYELLVASSACPPDDTYEPNDSFPTAAPLEPGTPIAAAFCGNDDYFAITADRTMPIRLDLTFDYSETDLELALIQPFEGTIASSTTLGNETISHTVSAGTYYVAVTRFTGASNTYDLKYTVPPSPPVLNSAVPGPAQVALQWIPQGNGGSPILSYTVHATPGGATCTTTSLTCVVTGLDPDTEYTFTVVATNAVGPSAPAAPSTPLAPLPTDCGTGLPGPFTDVSSTHPFCRDIEWLVFKEVTAGFADGSFRPGASITRQAAAAFLYRYSGKPFFEPPATPTFTDVPTSHPFFKEIEWMAARGIAGGFPDGTFRPLGSITRQASAAFFYRLAFQPPFTPPGVPSFTDVPLSHPFSKEIEWMADNDIAGGFADDSYRPGIPVTRQAFAAFLHRYDDLP